MDNLDLNFFDYAIIIFVFLMTLYGLLKGFLGTILTICVWVGTYYITFLLYSDVKDLLTPYIEKEMVLNIVANTVIFLPTFIILTIISKMITKSIHEMRLGIIDRSLGAALGLFASCTLVVLIFIITILLYNTIMPSAITGEDSEENVPRFMAESTSYPYLKLGSNFMMTKFSPKWLTQTKESIKEATDKPLDDNDLNSYIDNLKKLSDVMKPQEQQSTNTEQNTTELQQTLENMPDKSLVELYAKLTNKSKSEAPANRDDIVKEIMNLLNKQK